jgi:hypothetical protein
MDFSSSQWDVPWVDHPPTQMPEIFGQKWGTAAIETEAAIAKKTSRRKLVAERKSWDMALSPGKAVFMNLIMLWLGGSTPGIFSVLILGYVGSATFSSMGRVKQVFEPFRQLGIDCSLQSLLYVAINIATLMYITYCASTMGLIPTASGDWLSLIPSQKVPERSFGAMIN